MTETPQQNRVDTDHLRDYSQLRRSVTDRKIAGVAGGLGRHLNIDPTILRVAFVVLALFGGAGLLLYGALWLFVPEEGRTEAVISTSPSTRNAVLIAAAVVAAFVLLGNSWGGLDFPWPLAIVALVLFLVLMNREKPMSTQGPQQPWDSGTSGGPSATDTGTAARTEGPAPSAQDASTSVPGSTPGSDDTTTLPSGAGYAGTPYPYSGTVPPASAPYPVQQPPAPRPDRGPKLFWFTVALLAVALGSLGLYDVTAGGVADAAYPALALAVIGVMLVVGAWFGRPGGLIALGVLSTIVLLGTSIAEPRFSGDRRVDATPTSAVQVADRYFVPAGAVYLDLSDVGDLESLDGRTIALEANAGEIVVTIPEGVDVNVEADIAVAGEIDVLDETRSGTGVSLDRSIDGGTDVPVIDLELDLVVGHIEVRQ